MFPQTYDSLRIRNNMILFTIAFMLCGIFSYRIILEIGKSDVNNIECPNIFSSPNSTCYQDAVDKAKNYLDVARGFRVLFFFGAVITFSIGYGQHTEYMRRLKFDTIYISNMRRDIAILKGEPPPDEDET